MAEEAKVVLPQAGVPVGQGGRSRPVGEPSCTMFGMSTIKGPVCWVRRTSGPGVIVKGVGSVSLGLWAGQALAQCLGGCRGISRAGMEGSCHSKGVGHSKVRQVPVAGRAGNHGQWQGEGWARARTGHKPSCPCLQVSILSVPIQTKCLG